MSLPDFAALNERRAEQGLSTFMNPRNSAAGTIRQLDPKLAAERPLSFWGYQIGVTDGISFDSHWEALEWLRAHRFPVHPDVRKLDDRGRGRRAVPIVGAAARLAGLRDRRCRRQGQLGRAAATPRRRRPRSALGDRVEVPADDGGHRAERDRLEPGQVRRPAPVRDARARPGRRRHDQARDAAQRGGPGAQGHPRRRGRDRAARGRRDPAGAVAGAARRRAHRSAAAVHDRPSAARSATRRRSSPRARSSPAARTATAPAAVGSCSSTSSGAMDIDGLGEKQVDLFMRLGWVRTAADFYRLTAEQIAEQPGFGTGLGRQADRRDRGLQAPAVRPGAVRDRDRGGRLRDRSQPRPAASAASTRCSTADPEAIEQTQGVGPKMASRDPRPARRRADAGAAGRPARRGPAFDVEGPPPGEGPLAGKTLVLTGTLPELTREQATERIIGAGGRVTGSVSRRPTTSSPATAPAPSWPRPRSSGSR